MKTKTGRAIRAAARACMSCGTSRVCSICANPDSTQRDRVREAAGSRRIRLMTIHRVTWETIGQRAVPLPRLRIRVRCSGSRRSNPTPFHAVRGAVPTRSDARRFVCGAIASLGPGPGSTALRGNAKILNPLTLPDKSSNIAANFRIQSQLWNQWTYGAVLTR